jgi:two-component system invasion response regulator UvrY
MKKNSTPRLRLLITDDHATTRLGIRQILKEAFPKALFGEAADAAETLRLIAKSEWDLLILDISLPGGRDGLDVLRELKQTRPDLPVLMFSVHPENQFAVRALKLRAAGYLNKERAPEELAQAVRTILAGGTYASPSLTGQLDGRLGRGFPSLPHETLSEREFAVLRLVATGKPGRVIAAELGLSLKTVSIYRARVLQKMKLDTTADLIRYAVKNRLVT